MSDETSAEASASILPRDTQVLRQSLGRNCPVGDEGAFEDLLKRIDNADRDRRRLPRGGV